MRIAIIIPFYNEEENLIFFIREWERFLSFRIKLRSKLFFYFIDDGSLDKSVVVIKKNIKYLNFRILKKKNSGHGNTCKFGYNFIVNKKINKFDYLLQIDGDNQCDPKYFIKMYNLIQNKNYSFIFGYRKFRKDGNLRFLTSKIMSIALYLKKFCYVKDLNTPYRLMRVSDLKKILLSINQKKDYNKIKLFNCVLSYSIQTKYFINWIDINFRERYSGKSKFDYLMMLSMFFNFIIKI